MTIPITCDCTTCNAAMTELRADNDALTQRYMRVAAQRDAALAKLVALETRVVAVLNQYALDTCDIPNGGPGPDPEWVTDLQDALKGGAS